MKAQLNKEFIYFLLTKLTNWKPSFIKITNSEEYLVKNVLERKKTEQSDWPQKNANHWLIWLDGRTLIGSKGSFLLP